MIKSIRVDKISPHPDNPRKDLGDLTELAASIKSQGILQNLTVVPQDASTYRYSPKFYEGDYTVVIGHRRLAAAKLAGLEEVPCAISDMDPKTQVATMLLENLQRTDLTIWEQASGFQTLLDFGDTVEDVAGQTGFSESTIRRRVKLLELDQDKFRASVKRGGTLQDYAELDKISDIKLKNSVLEKIGTSEFQWKLKQAIDQEKADKVKAAMIEELETFATRVDKTDGLRQVTWFGCYSRAEITKPADAGKTKYFYTVSSYNIVLYKEATAGDESRNAGPSAEEQARQDRRNQLDQLNKQAHQLRQEFVRDYTDRKQDTNDIMAFALWTMLLNDFDWKFFDRLRDFLSIEIPEDADEDEFDEDEFTAQAVSERFEASPERVLLVAAYCAVEGNQGVSCHNWRGEYEENAVMMKLYDFLVKLGYKMSSEERALLIGTHELYARVEAKGAV